ncbi:MAG: hypothetical protein Q4G34_06600 [Micrococcus sp.]|nr:hypothetical protein [Micrococcus sp.]
MADSAPHSVTPAPAASRGMVDRVLAGMVVLGVVLTVVGFLALAALLVAYFANWAPWPPFYGLVLFAMPAGFLMMFAYVVITAVRRSRPPRRAQP